MDATSHAVASCKKCNPGFYQDETGASYCKASTCADGKYVPATNANEEQTTSTGVRLFVLCVCNSGGREDSTKHDERQSLCRNILRSSSLFLRHGRRVFRTSFTLTQSSCCTILLVCVRVFVLTGAIGSFNRAARTVLLARSSASLNFCRAPLARPGPQPRQQLVRFIAQKRIGRENTAC